MKAERKRAAAKAEEEADVFKKDDNVKITDASTSTTKSQIYRRAAAQ